MPSAAPFRPVDQQTFDIAIIGGGYSGYAAALRLHAHGRRVLLIERRATLLHESGWGFSLSTGRSDAPEWAELLAAIGARGGQDGRLIDGAIAEVVAAHQFNERRLPVLFYMQPVDAWRDGDGQLGAVAVGGKGGVRVIRARHWIDATPEGELLAVLAADWVAPAPIRQTSNLFFRRADWPDHTEADWSLDAVAGATAAWRKARWTNERVLNLAIPGSIERQRAAWLPALESVHARQPELMRGAVLTHGSVEAVGEYAAASGPMPPLPGNVTVAVASYADRPIAALAERFELGLRGADMALGAKAQATTEPPFDFGQSIKPARGVNSDVVVAGAGTGGAFAALAAAQQGARVVAVEPLPFVGGIGTGGGIHFYYYGVKGGLQEEIDDRTRLIMPLFGGMQQVTGFHPDAKKLVLETMLAEAGVKLMTGSTLFAVETRDRRIATACVASPAGPVALEAGHWIDATGDGDLAAMAGASYVFGRAHDGQLHAYSQSSGKAWNKDGTAFMQVVNYDAGFVDPTDAEDLTRARLVGVLHYLQQRYGEIERPTYIAPALGLRQGRQIRTRYVVQLSDLIERRTFPDAIGLTGCHYDNHAIDYEFESDEALFWVWCCRQWRSGRTACQMPYRMMLPEGLDNVWIACRAAGVSEEAHHSLRMQRDFQRLGEVAGIAAGIASGRGTAAPEVPYAALRQQLERSGALQAEKQGDDKFGSHATADLFTAPEAATAEQIAQWIQGVARGFGAEMYKLMRAGLVRPSASAGGLRDGVVELLSGDDADVTWRAATILAMWSDERAEPRLLKAIASREYGFAEDDKGRPEAFNRVVPNWIVAVALLRRCGTAACLPVLWELSKDAALLHNQRTTLALTCQHLATRLQLNDEQKAMLLETVRRLLETPAPNSVGNPQRKPVVVDQPRAPEEEQRQPVVEDFGWQLHLAVAKAEAAAGAPVHERAHVYLADPRALVRRAFNQVLQRY